MLYIKYLRTDMKSKQIPAITSQQATSKTAHGFSAIVIGSDRWLRLIYKLQLRWTLVELHGSHEGEVSTSAEAEAVPGSAQTSAGFVWRKLPTPCACNYLTIVYTYFSIYPHKR